MACAQGENLVQQRVAPPGESSSRSPITAFVLLERYNAIKLILSVHSSLAALSKVIRGSQLLSKEVHELAQALMAQEVRGLVPAVIAE